MLRMAAFPRRWYFGLMVASLLATGHLLAGGQAPEAAESWVFEQRVANLEYEVGRLWPSTPAQAKSLPAVEGTAWHGLIRRRQPGDPIYEDARAVPFLAEYVLGVPVRAWCDVNLNGDLTDDPAAAFAGYPGPEGTRSFLADLTWSLPGPGPSRIEWKVRVVLEPQPDHETEPTYRLQQVFARMGEIVLEGRRHRAILYDGNADGIYTREFGDGIFVDLDDDLHFDVDPMSLSFGPLSTPFQIGRRLYEVEEVAPDGARVRVRTTGAPSPLRPATEGEAAPGFEFTDSDGRPWRLADHRGRFVVVYFWSSRCGRCAEQAGPLGEMVRRFDGRALDVVGVSYDADRDEMAAFRRANSQTWPTSFTGRAYWENPVGRLYQAGASGLLFLVDPEGNLAGRFQDVGSLSSRLDQELATGGSASVAR